MDGSDKGDVGYLPAISAGTLIVFYLVWAALHDIAHGESDCTLEYGALVISIAGFGLLYRTALLVLTHRAKVAWLGGTGLLILLFDAGALQANLHPKYAADPMTGSLFLMGLIGYHLFREARARQAT